MAGGGRRAAPAAGTAVAAAAAAVAAATAATAAAVAAAAAAAAAGTAATGTAAARRQHAAGGGAAAARRDAPAADGRHAPKAEHRTKGEQGGAPSGSTRGGCHDAPSVACLGFEEGSGTARARDDAGRHARATTQDVAGTTREARRDARARSDAGGGGVGGSTDV